MLQLLPLVLFAVSFCIADAVQKAPYGSWRSPISSKLAAEGGTKITEDLAVDDKGRVFWCEIRSNEDGRYVINSYQPWDQTYQEWNPSGFSARTRAHEYGGGSFFISEKDGTVFFSNSDDNRLYKMTTPGETPKPVTEDNKNLVYADGIFVQRFGRIITIREDHTGVSNGSRKENVNTIVSINPDTMEQHVLVSGSDFYSSPKVSPDGKKLAWTQWNHPNMPWDSTEIYMATLCDSGDSLEPGSMKKVAGGENISANFPSWSLDGQLLFVSDQDDGWWNLFLYNKARGTSTNLRKVHQEIGCAQWTFGKDTYAFLQGPLAGKVATTYANDLGVLDLKTKSYEKVDIGQLKTSKGIVSSKDGLLYTTAAGPAEFRKVIQVDIANKKVKTIKFSNKTAVDEGYISVPKYIKFPSANNSTAYGYLYMPKNKNYVAPKGSLPPLVVRVHEGPTGQAEVEVNLMHQYLTSRGFAILDMDYRGSTGHGRAFRTALYYNWGIVDIEDVCNGAEHLVREGKVNPDQLFIDGGSAGGYTTLATLTFKDTFKAGVSNYGVSDLAALTRNIHKFESRYLDHLVGPYPEQEDVYIARSPLYHTDKLNKPLALFQGGDDKIVDPSQAEKMFKAVKAKGLPTAYVFFPEERHGFVIAKNIEKSIDGELYFYSKVFGFDAGIQVDMEIFNLPKNKTA